MSCVLRTEPRLKDLRQQIYFTKDTARIYTVHDRYTQQELYCRPIQTMVPPLNGFSSEDTADSAIDDGTLECFISSLARLVMGISCSRNTNNEGSNIIPGTNMIKGTMERIEKLTNW
jgi:hypothetical protein